METISHALGLSIAKAAASKKTYLTITRHTKTHSQKIQNLNNPASLPTPVLTSSLLGVIQVVATRPSLASDFAAS